MASDAPISTGTQFLGPCLRWRLDPQELTDDLEAYIGEYFKVAIFGDASQILGIRIIRDREKGELSPGQVQFAKLILERVGPVDDADAPVGDKEDEKPAPDVGTPADALSRTRYQGHIGSLMYLMLGARPDLAYCVGLMARFSNNPSRHHFTLITRIYGYVQRTMKSHLTFVQTPSSFKTSMDTVTQIGPALRNRSHCRPTVTFTF